MGADRQALDRQLKRQALQLAAMLPDDPDDAVKVLTLAYELIEHFVRHSEPAVEAEPKTAALKLVVNEGASLKP